MAQHFSELGKKILTIDLDPQSSLSEIQVNNFQSGKTLKDLPDQNTLNYVYNEYLTDQVEDIEFLIKVLTTVKVTKIKKLVNV